MKFLGINFKENINDIPITYRQSNESFSKSFVWKIGLGMIAIIVFVNSMISTTLLFNNALLQSKNNDLVEKLTHLISEGHFERTVIPTTESSVSTPPLPFSSTILPSTVSASTPTTNKLNTTTSYSKTESSTSTSPPPNTSTMFTPLTTVTFSTTTTTNKLNTTTAILTTESSTSTSPPPNTSTTILPPTTSTATASTTTMQYDSSTTTTSTLNGTTVTPIPTRLASAVLNDFGNLTYTYYTCFKHNYCPTIVFQSNLFAQSVLFPQNPEDFRHFTAYYTGASNSTAKDAKHKVAYFALEEIAPDKLPLAKKPLDMDRETPECVNQAFNNVNVPNVPIPVNC